jgi:hypothetical protein
VRSAGRAAFYEVNKPWESAVPFMYLCTAFKVTCAVGVVVEPVEDAMKLPFRHRDGHLATAEEIRAEFHRVKGRRDLAKNGGWYFKGITTLHLTDEGMHALVDRRLNDMIGHLRTRFREAWDNAPVDAQLGVACIAWGAGPWFDFPKFAAAFRVGDYVTCAKERKLDEDGPDNVKGTADDNSGVIPRNAGTFVMFMNAAHVVARKLDRETLHYPRSLSTQEAPTLPVLPPSDSGPVLETDGGASRWTATRDALYEK